MKIKEMFNKSELIMLVEFGEICAKLPSSDVDKLLELIEWICEKYHQKKTKPKSI